LPARLEQGLTQAGLVAGTRWWATATGQPDEQGGISTQDNEQGKAPTTGRGSQAAFSRAAEDLVSDHIGIPRNPLRRSGEGTIPGSGRGGFRSPDFAVHGPNGTLMLRESIVEVKASHSSSARSGLSSRDRAQIRDAIEHTRELRRGAANETDPVLRA